MTKRTAVVASVAICCIALIAGGQAQPPATTAAAQKTPEELLKQMIATAEDGRRMAEEAYRMGLNNADDLFVWNTRLTEARLAAATDKKSRVEVLQDSLKVAQEREHAVQARQRAGLALPTDLVTARYMRLQAELALAKEQAKQD